MQVHIQPPTEFPEIILEPASVAECPTCQSQQAVVPTREAFGNEIYLCGDCRSIFTVADKGATRNLAHALQDAAAMEVVF